MNPINENSPPLYLGLDVGGTTIESGIVSESGELASLNAVKSPAGGSREQVLAAIDAALQPFAGEPVRGIGVGFPSFGDYKRGVLASELSGFPSMHQFPLRQYLEDTFGLPVILVPDVNLFAHGILRFGEGRQLDDFMAVGLGTGTAIGLVRARKVLTGPKGLPDTTMRFYTEGGWPGARHSGYHFADLYGSDPITTHRRALAGDDGARKVWDQVGEALGETISRLAVDTQIHNAVIGGGIANAWELIEPSLRKRLQSVRVRAMKTTLPHPSLAGAAALFAVTA